MHELTKRADFIKKVATYTATPKDIDVELEFALEVCSKFSNFQLVQRSQELLEQAQKQWGPLAYQALQGKFPTAPKSMRDPIEIVSNNPEKGPRVLDILGALGLLHIIPEEIQTRLNTPHCSNALLAAIQAGTENQPLPPRFHERFDYLLPLKDGQRTPDTWGATITRRKDFIKKLKPKLYKEPASYAPCLDLAPWHQLTLVKDPEKQESILEEALDAAEKWELQLFEHPTAIGVLIQTPVFKERLTSLREWSFKPEDFSPRAFAPFYNQLLSVTDGLTRALRTPVAQWLQAVAEMHLKTKLKGLQTTKVL